MFYNIKKYKINQKEQPALKINGFASACSRSFHLHFQSTKKCPDDSEPALKFETDSPVMLNKQRDLGFWHCRCRMMGKDGQIKGYKVKQGGFHSSLLIFCFSLDVDTTKDPCQKVKCSRHKVCIAQGYQRAVCVNRKKLEHRWVCAVPGKEVVSATSCQHKPNDGQ